MFDGLKDLLRTRRLTHGLIETDKPFFRNSNVAYADESVNPLDQEEQIPADDDVQDDSEKIPPGVVKLINSVGAAVFVCCCSSISLYLFNTYSISSVDLCWEGLAAGEQG